MNATNTQDSAGILQEIIEEAKQLAEPAERALIHRLEFLHMTLSIALEQRKIDSAQEAPIKAVLLGNKEYLLGKNGMKFLCERIEPEINRITGGLLDKLEDETTEEMHKVIRFPGEMKGNK